VALRAQDIIAGRYTPPGFRYEFDLAPARAGYLGAKRAIDVLVALTGLIVASPLLVVLALAVLTSGRPILFRQVRIGKDGVPFTVLKFRTMYTTADAYARKPDDAAPTVTRAGRLIRTFGLDELPQLWNVLRGDMTLVGPRPEMPFVVESYDGVRRLRLSATPGVTGLWQLSPVRKEPIHDFIEYDLFYLAHRRILFDLWIIFRTPMLLLLGRHVELSGALIDRWGRGRSMPIQRREPRIVLDLTDRVARLEEALVTLP